MNRLVSGITLIIFAAVLVLPAAMVLADGSGCCLHCSDKYCPAKAATETATKTSCHHESKQSECQMKAACGHKENAILFSFEALISKTTFSPSFKMFQLLEPNRFLAHNQFSFGDTPPPKRLPV